MDGQVWDLYKEVMAELGEEPVAKEGADLNLVAVPYLMMTIDLKRVAPKWLAYTYQLKAKDRSRWQSLDVNWAAEMYAFVFALAQERVHMDAHSTLQVRDVENAYGRESLFYSVHTGRAWFPHSYEEGRRWEAREFMKDLRHRGYEVWCKCNQTRVGGKPWPAYEEIPWPLPDDVNFQTRITLTVAHDAFERF